MMKEVAQVGASPELEDQRKEESAESLKPDKVVPTDPAQRVGSGRKGSVRGVWWREGLSRRRDRGHLGPCPSSPGNCRGMSGAGEVQVGREDFSPATCGALSSRTTLSGREWTAWVTASVWWEQMVSL